MGMMSVSERAAARRGNDLEKRGDALGGIVGPPPGPVHIATVGVLTHLMTLGKQMSKKDTPVYLKTMMKVVEKSEPMMLEGLRDVPPRVIQQWMRELQAMVQPILDIPTEDEGPVNGGVDQQDSAVIATSEHRADLTKRA